MSGANIEELRPVTVSFDYEGHDTLQDVAQALHAFTAAFQCYAKSKSAKLKIVSFQEGSLQCNMLANEPAWNSIHVMAQDLADLQRGEKGALIPEKARDDFRTVLRHVSAFHVNHNGSSLSMPKSVVAILDASQKPEHSSAVVHSGILDRIDLKSNSFRILLPHGARITCYPCLPHLDTLSTAFKNSVPRIRVRGTGRFRSDLLPSSIQVSSVQLLPSSQSILEVLAEVANAIDKVKVAVALEEHRTRIESESEEPLLDKD